MAYFQTRWPILNHINCINKIFLEDYLLTYRKLWSPVSGRKVVRVVKK